MKYFKVMRGYGTHDFIPIDETELKKAIYAQITGKVAVFNEGSINGSHISAIMPDFHRALGFNYGYKLEAEDYRQIESNHKDYKGFIAGVKTEVQQIMQSGQLHLLGAGN